MLKQDKVLSCALIFVVLQLILAIFAPIIAGDPINQVILARMKGPSFLYPLGTDQLAAMSLRASRLAIVPR